MDKKKNSSGKKAATLIPVFAGTKLAKARKIIVPQKNRIGLYGKPILAIDADGELYEFSSAAEVERQVRISSGRLSSAINDYKQGKREVPLVEGFVWCYCQDKELLPKLQAWIALNAKDNRKTNI